MFTRSFSARYATMLGLLAAWMAACAPVDETAETGQDDLALALATPVRVVTANLNFALAPATVRRDWEEFSPRADVVLVQEAKNLTLREMVDTREWVVRQDTTSSATRGSAVLVRRSIARDVGPLRLIRGVEASPCPGGGIETRYIARVDVTTHNGEIIELASLHMPPARCFGRVYDTMADRVVDMIRATPGRLVVGADWNRDVDGDRSRIAARTALATIAPGGSIDGFLARRWIATSAPRRLAATHSDHHPVWVCIGPACAD